MTDSERTREELIRAAFNALHEFHLHAGNCPDCDKITCEGGDELWFAASRAVSESAWPRGAPATPERSEGAPEGPLLKPLYGPGESAEGAPE